MHLDMRLWNYLVSCPRFVNFEKTEPVGLEGKTLRIRSHVKLHFAPKPASSMFISKDGDNSDSYLWQSSPLKQVFPSHCQHTAG